MGGGLTMLEDLLAIAHLIDQEEDGSLSLRHTEWSAEAITLSLDITMDRYPDIHRHWQVICSGVRAHSLSLGFAYKLQLTDDHVLLWLHMKRRLSTYFSGKCETPDAIIGALYSRHWELTDGWIPFHRFFNSNVQLTKLIIGGSGMLAEGPEPLILAYEDVIQKFGFSTSHLDAGEPAYWNGETWLEEREKLLVLVLDRSYIVAEKFIAKMV
jgi:hypothetical protein